ncbi:multidrug resistance protein [Escherichia coli]|uniref:Multidrug resistance protein n=1 Tax=Escherichia coli TaxID=562 RepID=A0A376TY81_ECOLX|nr:multidrug resistance protein [Escherichia coli]
MANYFIDRPVFAWVLAIIMMLAGGLAIMNLPVCAVSADCATDHYRQRYLSRCRCANGRRLGHSGD